ncbi:non-canonical purine NTP pyrophosphatase [Anaerorhabdus furcosa]|uniref:XTP/dITP diphosphohydrolase n=1 Tax=Anaerorhabdus furcosa TaxID=118967 RepID=A0A1T4MUJ6_9FIRM|nr:non-canonical purine NTP pyrophosphatase [Anaerorhabdus furcosa]SJZ70643.1 XTP/dITP diphosphohydrolase [Anaerorhabdus furcosa]
MKVLYGTQNQGKLNGMREWLKDSDLDLEIIGLNDLNLPIPQVDESGSNPLENAIIKAKTYYQEYKMPVFSCDSGLFFEGLEGSLQPGTHVRRVNGKELSDEEMTEYYGNLASQYENGLIGKYQNAICFILSDDKIVSSMDESLNGKRFKLTSKPHPKRVQGFPIDPISLDLETNQYVYDLSKKEEDESKIPKGFIDFFKSILEE